MRVEAIGVQFDCHKLDLTNEIELNKFCDTIKEKYGKFISRHKKTGSGKSRP